MKNKLLFIVVSGFFLCACNNAKPDKSISPIADSSKPDSGAINTITEKEPGKTVILKEIEDGAYPMATLYTQDQHGNELHFSLNLENYKGPWLAELNKNIGQSIQVNYETITENDPSQIILNDRNLVTERNSNNFPAKLRLEIS